MKKRGRKGLIGLLLGACILFAGFAFSACASCEHPNAELSSNTATCTQEGVATYVCPDCGETWTETSLALGHLWDNGTAEDGVLCTQARTVTYTCTREGCEAVKEETLAAADAHQLDKGEVVKTATCTEPGERLHKCTNDGCTYTEISKIAATGHKLDGGTVSEEPTCTATGEKTYRCTAEGCSYSEVRTVAALGHDFAGADCEERQCTHAGCTETRPATAQHTYVKDESASQAASCDRAGTTVMVCSLCGDRYDVTEPALGHNVFWTTEEPVGGVSLCEKIVEHVGVCTTDGCDYTTSYEEKVSTHQYVVRIVEDKAATCSASGKKHEVCSVCGEVKADSEVSYSDETAHAWNDGVTEGGITTYTCTLDSSHTKTALVSTEQSAKVTSGQLKSTDEVSLDGAEIAMSKEAVDTLGGGEYTLAAEKATDVPDIGEELENEVYSITLTDGNNEAVTEFGGHKVTIRLPYNRLQEVDNVDAIYIAYIDENGEIEEIAGTYSNGYVTFTTTHFSYYTVRQYTAERMCELHGHNLVVSSKEATCAENGHYIATCTRCGAVVENRVTPALGHEWEITGEQQATCTVRGTIERKCKNCPQTSTLVEPARGHAWEEDAEAAVPATCTQAGSRTFECADCDAIYTETVAALGHVLRESSTPPTCTEAGYTTYRCVRDGCTYEYRSNYVGALGHTWDIASPTCGRGQVCLVCGAEGAAATGEHHMSDGVCTICGQGCTHEYAPAETVAPTCTERGYTIYRCSVCGGEEFRDFTPARGHDFSGDLSECSVCHAENPAAESIYNNLIRDLASGEYSLKISGGTISWTTTVSGGAETTQIRIELGELAVKVEDGKLLFSGTVRAEGLSDAGNTDGKSDVELDVYGDGTTFWGRFKQENYIGSDLSESTGDSYCAGSYERMISEMFGDSSVGETIEQVLTALSAALDGSNQTVNNAIAALIEEFMIASETKTGYLFTLDHAALKKLNDNLYTKNPAGVIDAYFGADSFANLMQALTEYESTTLANFKKLVLDNLDQFGFSSEDIVELINTVGSIMTGGPFDLDTFIEEYAEMTIGELVCSMTGAESYAQALEMIQTYANGEETVYELLSMMLGFSEDALPLLYQTAADLFGLGAPQLTITTDRQGFIEEIKGGAADLTYTFESEGVTFTADITATILVGESAGLENNADLKQNVSDRSDAVLTAIRTACRENGGTFTVPGRYADSVFTMVGNTLSLQAAAYLGGTGEGFSHTIIYNGQLCEAVSEEADIALYTISDVTRGAMISIMDDCGESYSVSYSFSAAQASSVSVQRVRVTTYYIKETREEVGHEVVVLGQSDALPTDTTGVYVSLYYNPTDGTLSKETFHDFVEGDATQPNGPCGSWVWYDVCTVCGAKGGSHSEPGIGHDIQRTIVYREEGATSCEQGIIVTEECLRKGCDYYAQYPSYNHEQMEEDIVIGASAHGDEMPDAECVVHWEHCLCGAEAWIDADAGDCQFYIPGDGQSEDKWDKDLQCYVYRCAVSGCDMQVRVTVEEVGEQDGCKQWTYTKYEFLKGEVSIRSFSVSTGSRWNHATESEDAVTGNPETDPEWTETHRKFCTNCDYLWQEVKTYARDDQGVGYLQRAEQISRNENGDGMEYVTIYEWDQYGRQTYIEDRRLDGEGSVVNFNIITTEYEGCVGTVVEEDQNGVYREHTVVNHVTDGTLPPTCTQYGGGTCIFCHTQQPNWDSVISGHYYVDGVCEGCGLRNEQETDSVFLLEDLRRNEAYAEEGTYVVGVCMNPFGEFRDLDVSGASQISVRIVDMSDPTDEGVTLDNSVGRLTAGKFGEIRSSMLYLLDEAAIEAAAQAARISDFNLNDYGVEVSFAPTWTQESGYVCSITITDHAFGA